MTFGQSQPFAEFVPENYEWPDQYEQYVDQFKKRYRRISAGINCREIASYKAVTPDSFGTDTTIETVTGQQWYNLQATPSLYSEELAKAAFRKVVRFPAALATGLNSQSHGLALGASTTFVFTKISGVIYRAAPPLFVPIPNDDVHVEVNATTVDVTIPVTYNGFLCYGVVLEYLKN